MLYILLIIFIILSGYFAYKYLKLKYGMDKICTELVEVQHDLTQNQIVHLPLPDKSLTKLLFSINTLLGGIQIERETYEKREKKFQKQIENISHDLRTPLTVILGYIKMTDFKNNTDITDNQELIDSLAIIEQKAETMKTLISQFYDYSRLNASDYEIDLSSVDVSRILRESLLGNYELLEQRKLQIQAEIPDYPILVLGNETALDRVFQNLFQNAGRYADSSLNISINETSNCIIISFTNDTRMLSQDDVPRIFERFYMQDESRTKGGTGLGLTVAKSLAEEMGAALTVKESGTSANNKLVISFNLTLQAI